MKFKKILPFIAGPTLLAACATPAIIVGINASQSNSNYSNSSNSLQNITYKYRIADSSELFDNEKSLFNFFLERLNVKKTSHYGSLNEDRAYLNKSLGLINIDNFASSSDKIHQAYIKMDSPENYLTPNFADAQKTYIKSQTKQYVATDGSIWNSETAALQRNKELISFLNLSLYEIDTYYGKTFLNPLATQDIEFFEKQAINQLSSPQSSSNPFSIKVMNQSNNEVSIASNQINRLFNESKNDWFKQIISSSISNSNQVNEINNKTMQSLSSLTIPISFSSEKRSNDRSKSVTTIVWKGSQNVGSSTSNQWLSAQASLDFLKNGLAEASTIKSTSNTFNGKYYQLYQVGSWFGEGGAPINSRWGSNMPSNPWIGMSLRFKTSSDYWVEMKNHNLKLSGWNPTHYLFEWGFYPQFQVKGFQNNETTTQLLNILKDNFISKIKIVFNNIGLSFTDGELNNIYSKLESDFKNSINNYTKSINYNWKKEDGSIDLITSLNTIINQILTNPTQTTIDTIVSAIVDKIKSQQHLITIAYNDVPVFKINSNIAFNQKISNSSSLKNIIIDTISNINVSTSEVENISQYITISNNQIKYDPTKSIINGSNYILPSNTIGLDHQLSTKEGKATNANGIYSSLYLFNKEHILTNPISKNVLFLYEKTNDEKYSIKPTKMGRITSLEDKKLPYTNNKTESIIWTEADWTALQSQSAPLPKEYMTLLGTSGEIIGRIPLEKESNNDELYFQKLYQQIVSNIKPKISNDYFYVEHKNGNYQLIKNNTIYFYSFEFENETFYFEDLNKALYYIYNRIFAPNVLKDIYINDILNSTEPLI